MEVTARIDPPDDPAQEVRGEAWLLVDEEARKLTWGSEGPNNYSGQLDLAPDGEDACAITVSIQTDNADAEHVQGGLRDAVTGVASALEERCA